MLTPNRHRLDTTLSLVTHVIFLSDNAGSSGLEALVERQDTPGRQPHSPQSVKMLTLALLNSDTGPLIIDRPAQLV